MSLNKKWPKPSKVAELAQVDARFGLGMPLNP